MAVPGENTTFKKSAARGGYQIADFKNAIVPINESGGNPNVVNVPGIYAAFSGIKPIQCNNLGFTGNEQHPYIYPTYVFPGYEPNTGAYYFDVKLVLEAVTLVVWVRPNDDVFATVIPHEGN